MNAPYGFLVEVPMPRPSRMLKYLPICGLAVAIGVTGLEIRSHNMLGTFRTENLQVDQTTTVGAVGTSSNVGVGVTNVNGPTRQTITIPGGAYDFGELNLATIDGVVPDFPHDLFIGVIRSTAAADTTAHSSHSGILALENNAVHSAGANPLQVTGVEIDTTVTGPAASGSDILDALHIFHGDFTSDTGNITLNGTSANLFLTGSSSFIATLGTIFAEGSGTNAIDITGNPTNVIKARTATPQFDLDNAGTPTLTFYNALNGKYKIQYGEVTTPTAGPQISPNTPASVNHGALDAGSTDFIGAITGIGANTSVTLTFSTNAAFVNTSWCIATPNASGTIEVIVATKSNTAPVFSCFNATTGAAANCVDFTYQCYGR